ncbi:inner membrane complex protein 1k, putative [Plasmodium sp. gorilla clade G2]|uniref:inner membrane complex protein 1k, putative n=1 Tax=Plasmodium sp. gorilla clade G2 TaxID=880535 RepID=UPI000D21E186|nr:inner membrane complex protein 1k, putative [Plasmodium sp. gorilla clade G2]SOV18095.1 inner membrane complex protein 1k, putative [Plasmodium sp. gorilla clade G2]
MDENSEINYDVPAHQSNSIHVSESHSAYEEVNKTSSESEFVNDDYSNVMNENNIESDNVKYIPDLYNLGKARQYLSPKVQEYGIPGQVSPYHFAYNEEDYLSNVNTEYDENGFPIRTNIIDNNDNNNDNNNNNNNNDDDNKKLWSWTNDGKLKLLCSQPIIPVSVVQGILRRDKIILIPQVEVTDVVIPKVYNQNIKHDVPTLNIEIKKSNVNIPNVKYVDKEIIIPIITGYTHKFVPKWDIHEVPRPVVKYIGEQKIVEVEVPEIKYIDKFVEREVIVDTVEKRVPKIIEVPKYVDEVKYVWKPIEKIVYVQKLIPKFDVNLECPPPLIVPYPVQRIKQIPPIMLKKNNTEIPDYNYFDLNSPEGSLPIPEEYIDHYSKKQKKINNGLLSTCCDKNQKKEDEKKNVEFVSIPLSKESEKSVYMDEQIKQNVSMSQENINTQLNNNMDNIIYESDIINKDTTNSIKIENEQLYI